MLDAHIVKTRRAFTVDVRLRLGGGERLGLFGASGAGKSTVMSCLAGIEAPDAGRISFGELGLFPPNLPLHRRPLAYLTQSDWLFPHLTVAENVCFGLYNGHYNGAKKWIDELTERLDLSRIWNAPVVHISGGQARRVALARMLARRPPVILLDEPFAALDRATTHKLIAAVLEWHLALGFILIAVDHRPEILEKFCTRAAVIESGQIVQEGAWSSLAAAPATALVARLLGVDKDLRASEINERTE
ncbi:MAG: ATP-binding cassette domain-containing protein [Deltaproteobacteria bacterium]|nr:ATP-binding cassette domain-containing protein [Deltaproteobacteria bacterium]